MSDKYVYEWPKGFISFETLIWFPVWKNHESDEYNFAAWFKIMVAIKSTCLIMLLAQFNYDFRGWVQ